MKNKHEFIFIKNKVKPMYLRILLVHLFSIFLVVALLTLNGCGHMQWINDDESIIYEESKFFPNDSENLERIYQQTSIENLTMEDVETLRNQNKVLVAEIIELDGYLYKLDVLLDVTQEHIESSLSGKSGKLKSFEQEVREMKTQVAYLTDEIVHIQSMKENNKVNRNRTPTGYKLALMAYNTGRYKESILRFQELTRGNPQESLKDNIEFWIGCNYAKLGMHDDAIRQFKTVLKNHPNGNKVHDSKYMLGLIHYRNGRSNRAIEIFELALKSDPPAEIRDKIMRQLNKI